ncbi:MAG: hypothetical protein JWO90_1847 [Solirubrobacterales bacterium]|jgi:hypothetical protein|nr:hypothetical protein [Solirubrobacterales bacterium]
MSSGTMTGPLCDEYPFQQAKPLLLVDVDGVISLWGWGEAERPHGAWTLVSGIAHYLSREAAARIAALQDAFELVWCTGWEDRANEHLPHLVGLGPLPHLSFERRMAGAASHGHWKLAAIDAHAGPERPLAWIDDDLGPACEAWAAARPGPTLLITTLPAEGFTAAQAAELRAWAAARA